MNILLIGQCSFKIKTDGTKSYPGGTEKVSDALIKALGKNSSLFFLHHNGSKNSIPAYKHHYTNLLEDNGLIPDSDFELIDYINSKNIDLVFVSGWMSETLIRCVKNVISKLDIPVIIYNHGSNCCRLEDYMTDDLMNKRNLVITNCTRHEEENCIELGFPKERLVRLINPVDFDEECTEVVENPNNRIMVVSRMVVGKGIPNVAKLCKEVGLELDIAGKKMRGHVVRDLEKIYPGHYNCLGVLPRYDLFELLRKHMFVGMLPNEPEGMNLSTLEGNMVGVPAIVWEDYEYSFSDFLDNEFNIFLKKDDNYIEQFKEEYLPRLDFYRDYENRKELQRRSIKRYGIDTYTEKVWGAINLAISL